MVNPQQVDRALVDIWPVLIDYAELARDALQAAAFPTGWTVA